VRRAVARSTKTDRAQTWLSVAGVAVAVALVVLVTSVGVALSGQGSVHGADYAIVPEEGTSSVIADVDAASLGRVHEVSADLAARDDLAAATPVRTDTVRSSRSRCWRS
jgi:putative ABC transport system permease protein